MKGTLYGTTDEGGESETGTVFSVTTQGIENVLYSFTKTTDAGSYPQAGLVYVKGVLYGTTSEVGPYVFDQSGTVFSITLSGTENVLYSFKGWGKYGRLPLAGLTNVSGILYGTTVYGGQCGTIFMVTTAGAEKVIHRFGGKGGAGCNPYAGCST